MTGPLLCSADDVRRLTKVPATVSDAAIESDIEAISDWFIRISKRSFSDSGTAKFYNARLDDLFTLPVDGAEVSEVRLTTIPALDPFVFNEDNFTGAWVVINGNQVQLYMFAPYFQALAHGVDAWVDRSKFAIVEVDWAVEVDVPPAVRDGIGLMAGAVAKRGPSEAGNLQSEKLGDYSYVLNTRGVTIKSSELSPMGWALLKPYVRRRVVVT